VESKCGKTPLDISEALTQAAAALQEAAALIVELEARGGDSEVSLGNSFAISLLRQMVRKVLQQH
jgi:hypothetical protein